MEAIDICRAIDNGLLEVITKENRQPDLIVISPQNGQKLVKYFSDSTFKHGFPAQDSNAIYDFKKAKYRGVRLIRSNELGIDEIIVK